MLAGGCGNLCRKSGAATREDSPVFRSRRDEADVTPSRSPLRSLRRRRCRATPRRAWRRAPEARAISVTRMRAPEAPIGWPSAQAPPLTLTFSCGKPEIAHRRHGDDGEGLVDLEEIDGIRAPAGLLEQLFQRADRRGGEIFRRGGVGRMRDDARKRGRAALLRLALAHHDERRGAVGDRARIGGRHRAAVAERGLERRDLVRARLGRLLVRRDQRLGLARLHADRRDLPGEIAAC